MSQPVGVVGAITPWNFPLAMITRKVCFEPIHFNLDNGPYLIFKNFKTCPCYICFVFKIAVWVCVHTLGWPCSCLWLYSGY